MLLLIGSKALLHYTSFNREVGIDYDYIATHDSFKKKLEEIRLRYFVSSIYPKSDSKIIVDTMKDGRRAVFEFEIAWAGSCAEEILNLPNAFIEVGSGAKLFLRAFDPQDFFEKVATLNLLYFLKSSHKYLKNSSHFSKTMNDLKLLSNLGAYIPDEWNSVYERREKETYIYSHPSLKMSKQAFFDPSVKYVYDHDSIHWAVKHLDSPAYEYFKSENEEVFCDREKFFSLPLITRQYAVLEEVYVLALERSQIPFNFKHPIEFSFKKALEKVCTSITSGWFREFAYNNYDEVVKLFEKDHPTYLQQFQNGVLSGIVKKL